MSHLPQPTRLDVLARSDNNTQYYTGLAGVDVGLDSTLTTSLALSILATVSVVLLMRVWQLCSSHLRHIYCLTANQAQQNYWSFDRSRVWPWLKRNVLYAPLGKKRHNRELQLSKAHNYGTIPGRVHTLILGVHLVGNIVFCSLLDYTREKPAVLAELRGRAGILATVNLVPLVIMAGRNNPLIGLLKISFDTFNMFHRWIGRLIAVEAVMHVLAWAEAYRLAKGASEVSKSFYGDPFLQYGLIGVVCMSIIVIQSLSPIRHAFYETFLATHQLLAFFAILCVYMHIELPNLPALPYIKLAACMWIADRVLRFARLLYVNYARKMPAPKVTITALPGEASRMTFQLPRHITIRPGSHVYVYLPRISLWQSHPFSVAWTNSDSEPATGGMELLPPTPKSPFTPNSLEHQQRHKTPFVTKKPPTTLSLICVARSGMTRQIYNSASASATGSITMPAYIEGPYAGHDSLASYGTVFLYCAGGGITHHLVQIRHLLACAAATTVATRKIVLVWSVRDAEAFGWVRDWMNEIIDMPGRKDILKMFLYVTRPKHKTEFLSKNQTLKAIPGRCVPGDVLDRELPSRVGATMVSVCGPGAFADEVRDAVRSRLGVGSIDFNEESFTW